MESRLDTILADEDTSTKDSKRLELPLKKESPKIPAATKVQHEGMVLAQSAVASILMHQKASLGPVRAARTMTVYKSDWQRR